MEKTKQEIMGNNNEIQAAVDKHLPGFKPVFQQMVGKQISGAFIAIGIGGMASNVPVEPEEAEAKLIAIIKDVNKVVMGIQKRDKVGC